MSTIFIHIDRLELVLKARHLFDVDEYNFYIIDWYWKLWCSSVNDATLWIEKWISIQIWGTLLDDTLHVSNTLMQTLKCKLTGVEVEYNKKMQQSSLPQKIVSNIQIE